MAQLNDCIAPVAVDDIDASLVAFVNFSGGTVTREGVDWPVLEAIWSEGAPWYSNFYVAGVQIEYQPYDGSAAVQRTATQGKEQLSWSVQLTVGGDYLCRYRAVGRKSGFGVWSDWVTVAVPVVEGLVDRTRPVAAGIIFTPNPATNVLSWTAGTMSYHDPVTGVAQTISVSSGSATQSGGTLYIFWELGDPSFGTTTSYAVAAGLNCIVIATYDGGTALNILFGRTQITPEMILTPFLSAIVANIGVITSGKLQSGDGHTFLDLTNSRQQFRIGSFALRIGNIGSGVLLWYGPTSVAIGDESRTNGRWAFGDDGEIYMTGGTVLPPGGGGGGGSPGGDPSWEGVLNPTLSGGGWSTVWAFNLNNVASGMVLYFSLSVAGSETATGASMSGEFRIIEVVSTTVISDVQPVTITNLGDDPGVAMSGTVSATGTVAYGLQFRRTGGDSYANLNGYGYASAAPP